MSASPFEPHQQQKVLRNLNHKNQNEDPGDPEPTVSGPSLGEPGSLPEYCPCPGRTEGSGLSQAPPLSRESTAQGEESRRMSAPLFAKVNQSCQVDRNDRCYGVGSRKMKMSETATPQWQYPNGNQNWTVGYK